MILITGVTGTVGREVATQLAAEHPTRLMARNPDRTTVPHTEKAQADYNDQRSLRRALQGVRAAFLVTNHPTEPHDERFLEAAAAEGVAHIVKLSAAVVADETDDFITQRQRAIEQAVRTAGMTWTLLRPRAFMSNTLAWAQGIRSADTVSAQYGDAPNAPVDPRDVARTAARALTEEGHENKTYTLTGPERLTPRDQTRILSEVLSRPLHFREQTHEEAKAHLTHRFPPPVAEALLQRSALQSTGGKSLQGNTPPDPTGRPPTTYGTWAKDHAHLFA
ncbi:NAD(P)H-binding protein [Streptomyces sp. NBC_01465]|uniref:NAD(P)H-binding protein n=1 Tax=Streptomyces sp. NBC_01465 TaxID=2903878 RepID=UPI002E3075FF|nr:NAD(P)H-binding protein [Streptomyces sp. NBC_01465]